MSNAIFEAAQHQLRWLKESGIQHEGGPDDGGVHAWRDERTHRHAYLYSEITGYFMSLAHHVSRYDRTYPWVERAERAARWICDVALLPSGAVLTRKYEAPTEEDDDPYQFHQGLTLFFDCAMVGFGLVNVYRATRKERWLACATRIADFSLEAFESRGGLEHHAIYDTQKALPLPEKDHWSQNFGPFEVKGGMFFEALAQETGERRYRKFAERLLAVALARQQSNGRFGTSLDLEVTHLHPHFYTVEGLLYLGTQWQRPELIERAGQATDFAFSHCLKPGGPLFQAWSERESRRIRELRSDVLAQSLRAYWILKLLQPDRQWPWERHIQELEALLDTFTLPGGGTSYCKDEHGRRHEHANAWCHFFRLEARIFRTLYEQRMPWNPAELLLT